MEADSAQVALAIGCFKKLHQRTIGSYYLMSWGKDQKLLKEIVGLYGLDKTVRMMKVFFRDIYKGDFTKKAGATVGVFRSQIPKIIMQDDVKENADRGTLHAESLGNP